MKTGVPGVWENVALAIKTQTAEAAAEATAKEAVKEAVGRGAKGLRVRDVRQDPVRKDVRGVRRQTFRPER